MNRLLILYVAAWLVVFALLGGVGGFTLGVKHAPSYQDAVRIEKRLREVFCEQAVATELLKKCEVKMEVK